MAGPNLMNAPARFRSWLLSGIVAAAAAGAQPQQADAPQQERLRQAVRTLLISLAQDPSFQGFSDGEWNLVYSQDALIVTNFGAILGSAADVDSSAGALQVLAVTPNSSAAEMGIRSGDRIRRFNGQSLIGPGRTPTSAEFAALLEGVPDGGAIAVEVERNGLLMQLAGSLERWRLPAVSLALTGPVAPEPVAPEPGGDGDPEPEALVERQACGTLSLHHSPPHRHDLYPAYLTGINERRDGAVMRRFHYLQPGRYRLTLSDLIPEHELRRRHTRFESRREPKELQLEVEDGMVYHLGSRLLYDRKQQKDHDEYWKPVVWRMEPGYCKGNPVAR